MLLRWILFALCFGNATREDTSQLAQHLERFRHYKEYDLSAAEYRAIQREFLAWVDLRVKGGKSVEEMNGELKQANLLSTHNDSSLSNVGFLGGVSEVKLSGKADVSAIKIEVFTGKLCNFDQTVALYSGKPLHRMTLINAEQAYSHGYFLRVLAVGGDLPGSGRIIGSDWVATSCAGNWNSNILRIELTRGGAVRNLLKRDILVFGGEDLAMNVEKNVVSFEYASGFRDVDILVRKGVARYRVEPNRVVRLAPIAKSFAGFIDEWLRMNDSEAARWATPAASARHHALVSKFEKERFTLESAADCPGPQPSRAIGVEGGTVFLVSGNSAAEMRMVAILDKIPSSCRGINRNYRASVLSEPSQ